MTPDLAQRLRDLADEYEKSLEPKDDVTDDDGPKPGEVWEIGGDPYMCIDDDLTGRYLFVDMAGTIFSHTEDARTTVVKGYPLAIFLASDVHQWVRLWKK